MGTAYLVRHAEPVAPGDHSGPDIERPLSDRGLRQAAWIARRLAGLGVTAVRSSPYRRCRETAQIIANALGLDAKIDPDLHITSAFDLASADLATIYVAHSNNIPVALAELGLECHACSHASCWTVRLDEVGNAVGAEYVSNSQI